MSELKQKSGNEKFDSEVNLELRRSEFQSNLWKSYLFSILICFHFISGILLPFFMDWGGLTFFETLLLQGFFTLMILVFEVPCGAIADYLSRKLSILLAALVTSFAALIYGTTPHILVFIIGEMLWGFGGALLSGTHEAFIYDTLRKLERTEEMKKIMAKKNSMMLTGILISAPIGSLMALTLPLNVIMQLMFFPFIAATVLALTFKEPNHDLIREESQSYIEVIKSGFAEIKNNRILRILAVDTLIVDVLVFFLIWTYQLYLMKLGVPILFFGFVSSFMTISRILCMNLAPKLEGHFKNKKRFMQVYTILPGIGFILMAIILFPLVSILLIVFTIGLGMSRNILFVNAINKEIETENRATALSTISMMVCVVRGAVYPLVGLAAMISLEWTFIALGVGLITTALLTRVKNEYLA